MRCVQHTGNSNHYLACRGTKPREAIDYLFDMLLKPGGQGEKGGQGQKQGGKKEQRVCLTNGWRRTDRQVDRNQTYQASALIKLSALCVCLGKSDTGET